MKRKHKPFPRMTAVELAKATREFDREFVIDTFAPPDDAARARHRRAKRQRGRPIRGRGSKPISVTVERSLLAKADAFAKKHRLSRASLIELGLWMVLKAG